MGLCFSCHRTPERDPLLRTTTEEPPIAPKLHKAADVLAAINSRKLPSQDQLNSILRKLLKSNVLSDPAALAGYGPLSDRSRKVMVDARELIEATLQIGMEKNHDDRLQDLVFQGSSIDENSVRIDADVQAKGAIPPTPTELTADASNFLHSLKRLLRLLLSSAAFRTIVSDILSTARELVADVAADISNVALHVQISAEQVEEAARLDSVALERLKAKTQEAAGKVQDAGSARQRRRTVSQDPTKDIIVGRIQAIIIQANNNPEYRSALRTIWFILHKYSSKLRFTASATTQASPPVTIVPTIWTDPHVTDALTDLKIILERAASGLSLDPLLDLLLITISDIIAASSESGSDLMDYFSTLGEWLDRALSRPEYITSLHGTRATERLYDATRSLLASTAEPNSKWAQDVRSLLDQTDALVYGLRSDRTTTRFVQALDSLLADTRTLAQDTVTAGTVAQRRRREEFVNDVFGWFVPRVLRSLRAIPMPRVEFQNDVLDLAVEALLLEAAGQPLEASLVPDRLIVQNWSELRLEPMPKVNCGRHNDGVAALDELECSSSTSVRLHVEGMRVSARGIGYYVRYKPLGYEDQGLLSVDVGGQGVAVDVVLMTTSSTGAGLQQAQTREPLFRVADVNVAVKGLTVSIDRSKHWIVNKVVVQPLLAPLGRWIVGKMLEAQVRTALEAVERVISDIVFETRRIRTARAEGDESSSRHGLDSAFTDYWDTLLRVFSRGASEESSEAVSNITVGMKGIVRTTTTQPSNGATQPSETVLAIAEGAQLFPGKAGPYCEDDGEEVGSDVGEAVMGVVSKTRSIVGGIAGGVVSGREDLGSAQTMGKLREREERQRHGWRSQVFDL